MMEGAIIREWIYSVAVFLERDQQARIGFVMRALARQISGWLQSGEIARLNTSGNRQVVLVQVNRMP